MYYLLHDAPSFTSNETACLAFSKLSRVLAFFSVASTLYNVIHLSRALSHDISHDIKYITFSIMNANYK